MQVGHFWTISFMSEFMLIQYGNCVSAALSSLCPCCLDAAILVLCLAVLQVLLLSDCNLISE